MFLTYNGSILPLVLDPRVGGRVHAGRVRPPRCSPPATMPRPGRWRLRFAFAGASTSIVVEWSGICCQASPLTVWRVIHAHHLTLPLRSSSRSISSHPTLRITCHSRSTLWCARRPRLSRGPAARASLRRRGRRLRPWQRPLGDAAHTEQLASLQITP